MSFLSLLALKAQEYDYEYDYSSSGDADAAAGAAAGFFAFLAAIWLVVLAIVVITIVGMWKVFEKAGKPGWAAIIPIYNIYILLTIINRPIWWIVVPFLSFIPVVGGLLVLAWSIVVAMDLGKSFGKDTGYSIVMLWLLSPIGYVMLGFGKDKYLGPKQSVLPNMVGTPGAGGGSKTPPPPSK